MNKTALIVTSIFSPNGPLRSLAEGAVAHNWDFFIIGDVLSPADFNLTGAKFYAIQTQRELPFKLSSICPERHYSRKNIGYLLAIKNGINVIVETDDDNLPKADFWLPRQKYSQGKLITGKDWLNVYHFFSKENIWPRGLPLEEIHSKKPFREFDLKQGTKCYVQQGLADGNPDVDSVYRMTQKLPVVFDKSESVVLDKGVWCPFNSQNTTWFHEAFPLLYLPSYCSFRMTDIWRSFVTQRIMWECDWKLQYHNATVWQERNEHRLIRDFELEVPGYLYNNKIRGLLEDLPLKSGVGYIYENMLLCYEELVREMIITNEKEIDLLQAWISDIKLMIHNANTSS